MIKDSQCIEVENVYLKAEDGSVWSNVSFSVATGTISTVSGLTGPARTLIMRMLAGLTPITDGVIRLWGRPISAYNRHQLNADVRLVSSRISPGFSFTVRELIGQGCELRHSGLHTVSPADLENVERWMDQLHMTHLARRDCTQLGRSDRVRVGLAQAMMCTPALILMDDPIDHLQADVIPVLTDFLTQQSTQGMTVLLSSDSRQPTHALSTAIIDLAEHAVQNKAADRLIEEPSEIDPDAFLF